MEGRSWGRKQDVRGPAAFVAVALWLGLVVGLVEVAEVVARAHLAQYGLYRKSPHLIWMVPVSDLLLYGLIGVVLGFLVWPLPRIGRWTAAMALGVLALATPLLAIPGLRGSSSLIGAIGLASWLVPAVRARANKLRWPVLISAPVLGVIVLGLMVTAFVRQQTYRAPLAATVAGGHAPQPPNVLFIVLDTVRADATGVVPRGAVARTPSLVALAQRGARFERTVATSPWSLPSHASMFTGRWVWELGVGPDRALDGRYPTLAEYFRQRGYDTAGFVANTSFCTAEYGLAHGFGHYEDYVISPLEIVRSSSLGWLLCSRLVPVLDRVYDALGWEASHPLEVDYHRKDAATINQQALRWISQQDVTGRPFFAFLNYFDTHDPYLVPSGANPLFRNRHPLTLQQRRAIRDWIFDPPKQRSPESYRLARQEYDDCLMYLDDQIGRLIRNLERLGRLDHTIIVVTSDHGEHFGEHERDGMPLVGHRQSVYQAEIHVPLLIIAPGRVASGSVVPRAVSLRNLPMTLIDLCGLESQGKPSTAAPFPGRSLFTPGREPKSENESEPKAESETEFNDPREAVLAEFMPRIELPVGQRYQPGAPGLQRAVVTADRSYHAAGVGPERLFDLAHDPNEQNDLGQEPATRAGMAPLRDRMKELIGPK